MGWSGLHPGGAKTGKAEALLSPVSQKDPTGNWELAVVCLVWGCDLGQEGESGLQGGDPGGTAVLLGDRLGCFGGSGLSGCANWIL